MGNLGCETMKHGEVVEAVESVEINIEVLFNLRERLANKLSNISRQEEQKNKGDKPYRDCQSVLGSRISSCANRLDILNEDIERLINLLEI